MAEEIAIAQAPAPQEEGLISVAPSVVPESLPENTAKYRAAIAQPAITAAGVAQTYEDTVKLLQNGEEKKLREFVAAELNAKRIQVTHDVIKQITQKQGSLTEEETTAITNLVGQKFTDPKTVFEEFYGTNATQKLEETANNITTILSDIKKEIPHQYNAAKSKINDSITKREHLVSRLQDATTIADEQGTFSFLLDVGKNFATLGLYKEAKFRGQVEEISKFYGLLGTNMEEQFDNLYSRPLPEFVDKVDKIYKGLSEDNPGLAVEWLKAMLGRSANEVRLENMWSAFDLSAIGTLGGAAGKTAKAAYLNRKAKDIMNDTIKAHNTPDPTGTKIIEATGDIGAAAQNKAVADLVAKAKGELNPDKEALEELFTVFRQDMNDASRVNVSTSLSTRLKNAWERTEDQARDIILNTLKVDRMSGVFQLQEGMIALRNYVKDLHPSWNNAILDIGNPIRSNVTGGLHVPVYIGKADGTLFLSESTAKNMASKLGLKSDVKIVSDGTGPGALIQYLHPVDETQPAFRDLLLKTAGSEKPMSRVDELFQGILGWGRTPEDTLSIQHNIERKTATFASSNFMKILKDESQYLKDLFRGLVKDDPVTGQRLDKPYRLKYFTGERGKRSKEFERILKVARDLPDENGKPGKFFKDPLELEEQYLKTLGRSPDSVEVEAYFAYKRVMELDRIFRNMAIVKGLERIGAKTHSFTVLNQQGQKVQGPSFVGVVQKHFPGGDDSIAILINKFGKEKVERLGSFSNLKLKQRLETGVLEGQYHVVRIVDPEARPLQHFGNIGTERIRYIITDKLDTRPLEWEQIPRRGGGHYEYEYNYYIKQARIVPEYDKINKKFHTWYEGDATFAGMTKGAEAKELANHMNQARLLLKANKLDEAREYIEKHTTFDWDDFHGWFKPSRDPSGNIINPRFDINEPFGVTPNGKNLIDDAFEKMNIEERYRDKNFKNGLKEGSDIRQMQVQFMQERDAYELLTANRKGTKYNPVYSLEGAEIMDPMPSIDRAVSRIVDSLFFNDYKTYAIERWIEQARNYMKHPDEIRYAPMWYFHNPDWKNTDPAVIRRLEAERWKIERLLGTPSKLQSFLHHFFNKLHEQLYEGIGPQAANIFVPEWALSKVKDPWMYIRSAIMHMNLGLFAVPQVLVQMQTYSMLYGIAGFKHANAGSYGAYLTLLSRVNRGSIDKLDELASNTKWNVPGVSHWKPGEFKESLLGMEKSGFAHVANEHALVDVHHSPKMVQSMGKEFLDWGLMFFRGGERAVRWGAWHTAYKEFRTAHPTGKISDVDWKGILQRADLLSGNMSRASNSALQTGIFSVPAQFLSYQMRIAEQFWGKRWGDNTLQRNLIRARVAGIMTAMYGFTTATGVTGIPFSDYIRKAALEGSVPGMDPYVVGDKWAETVLMEGLPSYFLAMVTGKHYNIGDRYGIKGFDVIKEALRGDEWWLSVMAGAAGSKFADILTLGDPFFQYMLSHFRDEDKNYQITTSDVLDLVKIVSEGNNIHRTIMAVNSGKWFGKKGSYLDKNIGVGEAIFLHLTGLQPQKVSDLHLLTWSAKDLRDLQTKAMNKAVEEFRKGMQNTDNPSEASKYFSRAFGILRLADIEPNKWGTMISRGAEQRTLIEQMDWNYFIKNAPSKMREKYLETYSRRRQLEENQ